MLFPCFLFFLISLSSFLLQLLFQDCCTGFRLHLPQINTHTHTLLKSRRISFQLIIHFKKSIIIANSEIFWNHWPSELQSFSSWAPTPRKPPDCLNTHRLALKKKKKARRTWTSLRRCCKGNLNNVHIRVYLLSSEAGFNLLPLVKVLQSDLPQPCQVLLQIPHRSCVSVQHNTSLHPAPCACTFIIWLP